jgi:predicted metal-binding protein
MNWLTVKISLDIATAVILIVCKLCAEEAGAFK